MRLAESERAADSWAPKNSVPLFAVDEAQALLNDELIRSRCVSRRSLKLQRSLRVGIWAVKRISEIAKRIWCGRATACSPATAFAEVRGGTGQASDALGRSGLFCSGRWPWRAAMAPSRARSSSAKAGRWFCRCRTAIWWRNTMRSRSFERPLRTASRASNARNR